MLCVASRCNPLCLEDYSSAMAQNTVVEGLVSLWQQTSSTRGDTVVRSKRKYVRTLSVIRTIVMTVRLELEVKTVRTVLLNHPKPTCQVCIEAV